MRSLSLSLLGVLLSLLAGCGFHLAGREPLPPALHKLRIELVAPYAVSEPPLETALRSRLRQRGAQVVESSGDDVAVLQLSQLGETREMLSISADGKALEFLLTTRVSYQLRLGQQVLLAPTELYVTRDYSFDQEQILAKEAEEIRLRQYMQTELADRMLQQLIARLAQQPSVTIQR